MARQPKPPSGTAAAPRQQTRRACSRRPESKALPWHVHISTICVSLGGPASTKLLMITIYGKDEPYFLWPEFYTKVLASYSTNYHTARKRLLKVVKGSADWLIQAPAHLLGRLKGSFEGLPATMSAAHLCARPAILGVCKVCKLPQVVSDTLQQATKAFQVALVAAGSGTSTVPHPAGQAPATAGYKRMAPAAAAAAALSQTAMPAPAVSQPAVIPAAAAAAAAAAARPPPPPPPPPPPAAAAAAGAHTTSGGTFNPTTLCPTNVAAQPHPATDAGRACEGGFSSSSGSSSRVYPTCIPKCHVDRVEVLKVRYGSSTLDNPAALEALTWEIDQLQGFCQNTLQLDRPSYMLAQSDATWFSTKASILQYTGYLYSYEDVERPSLQHYSEPYLFARFVAFLVARQVKKSTIKHHINAAQRALHYLRSCDSSVPDINSVLAWYSNLYQQISHNLVDYHSPTDKCPEALRAQGRWADMEELVVIVEQLRVRALEAYRALGGSGGNLEVAKLLHDALFACFCIGHLPPMRPSVLRSLEVPGYTGPCLRPDCNAGPGCKGNRLFWQLNSDGEPELWLDVPHHKVVRAWGGMSITFRLPAALTELVSAYLEWAHTTVCLGADDNDASPFLFVNTNTGQQLQPMDVTRKFQQVVLAGTGKRFGPQMVRSIFVHDRREGQSAPGPEDEDAAAVMGHNVRMWDAVYEKGRSARSMQRGVDGMDAYRAELLGRQASSSSTSSAGTAEATAATAATAAAAAAAAAGTSDSSGACCCSAGVVPVVNVKHHHHHHQQQQQQEKQGQQQQQQQEKQGQQQQQQQQSNVLLEVAARLPRWAVEWADEQEQLEFEREEEEKAERERVRAINLQYEQARAEAEARARLWVAHECRLMEEEERQRQIREYGRVIAEEIESVLCD